MRPTTCWADLRGDRVGLWGLGTEGRANLRALRAMGVEPVIVDDRPNRVTDEEVLATADGGLDALMRCSAVVKTPGISRYDHAVSRLVDAQVPVLGGLGLWLAGVDLARVVCVTGTKGKSTTTSIIAHLARGLGLEVFAGGNLGTPPWDPDAPTAVDMWVIETSSYQATDVSVSPPVVAVTSLFPDHQPWHRSVEAYYRDKLSLCTQPGARVTVAAHTSALVERRDQLGPEVRWVTADSWPGSWFEPLGLLGEHNLVNAGVARSCLAEIGVSGADDDDRVATAAVGFGALDSRLEPIAELDGVAFIDDNLSTAVESTVAALDSFPGRRVALIAGGFDRDTDYEPLAAALTQRGVETLVLTVYTTGPRIHAAIEARGAPRVTAVSCRDLDDAVHRGYAWARPDGVVLLSPAAASFDAFDDYRHRGRVFRAAVDAVVRAAEA